MGNPSLELREVLHLSQTCFDNLCLVNGTFLYMFVLNNDRKVILIANILNIFSPFDIL